jgi:hypothetical protein
MPVYSINYTSVNTYEPPFFGAVLEYLIFPLENPVQKVINKVIKINPETPTYFSKNINGFDILRCRLKKGLETFELHLEAKIEKQDINPFAINWLSVSEETELLNSIDNHVENYYFLQQGKFTSFEDSWDFPVKSENESVFEFAQRVNKYVFDYIEYNKESLSIDNVLSDILIKRKGVCQDYAHLMIAIIRENKIPARYVSGYLDQGNNFEGSSAIHAWVEVQIPGAGWIGFDPTNNLIEDHHYIKISHGIDYSECSSLKGVIKSVGNNITSYNVKITEHLKHTDQ